MRSTHGIILSVTAVILSEGPLFAQQVITNGTTYTQNFNSLGSGLPTGWGGTIGADATSLGSTATFTSSATQWSDTSSAVKNLAAATIASNSSATAQANSTDRSFGSRQTNAFGDAGLSFNFNFNTTSATVTSISFEMHLLNPGTRSTTFTFQYGIGASPTTWSNFTGTTQWTDPGTFGVTTFTLNNLSDMGNLSNVPSAWFRAIALDPSTGTGTTRDTIGIDNFSMTTVPEPATALGLSGMGLCLAGFVRRCCRRV